MILQGSLAASFEHVAEPGVRKRVRIIGLAAMVGVASMAAFVASTSATADPGCLEFRNPATGICEPYFLPAPPPPVGVDTYLSNALPLFAASTEDDVLVLGQSVCKGIERGKSLSEIRDIMVRGGVEVKSADTVAISARRNLCPPS